MMKPNWSSEYKWQSLVSRPGNFLAWNLGVLEDRDPECADRLRTYQQELSKVEVVVSSPAHIGVRWPNSEPVEVPLSPTVVQAFQNRIRTILDTKPPVIVWPGCGLGQWLLPLFQQMLVYPGIALWVYERDPLQLSIGMSLWDWGPVLASGRVFWALGDDFETAMETSVRRYGLFMKIQQPPPVLVSPEDVSQEEAKYQIVVQRLTQKILRWRGDVLRNGDSFLQLRRQRSAQPMRVWSAVSVNHYAARPIFHALHRGLTENGMQSAVTETLPGMTALHQKRIGSIVARPDTVLSLNYSTRIDIPAGELHRVVWVTDDPQFQKSKAGTEKRFTEDELVLFADPLYREILVRQGAQRLGYLPEFALLDRAGDPANGPAYPLLFVGVIHPVETILQNVPSEMRELLDTACHAVLQSSFGTVGAAAFWRDCQLSDSFLQTARNMYAELFHKQPVPDRSEAWLVELTYTIAVNRKRAAIAKALFPLGLHVHGNAAWNEIAGDRYRDRCHPTVRYEALADLYAAAGICINIHSPQLPTGLNIRDFDVLRAGGCLLADPVAEMNAETLLPGRDCLTVESPEAFAETASSLLRDEQRRRELALTGQATVLERHLACHRAKTILELLANA